MTTRPLWIIASIWAYSQTATAHYPHDPAAFVAATPGPDPTWVLTSLFRNEAWMVARSPDDRNMEIFFVGPDTESFVTGGAMLDENMVLLTTDRGGLWESRDAGLTWVESPVFSDSQNLQDIEASPAIMEDGTAIMVGQGGIWRSSDTGDSWTLVSDTSDDTWIDMDMSPRFEEDGMACGVTDRGRVLCTRDRGQTWTVDIQTDEPSWSVSVGSNGQIFVGRNADDGGTGGLILVDESTESWTELGFAGESIPTLESLADGTLLVTLPLEGVWRSTNEGQDWNLQRFDLEIISPAQNGPNGEHFFEFETTQNGSVYLATWEGLVRSDDSGQTWNRIHTALQTAVRDVDMAYDQNGDLLVLMASYGGGLQLIDVNGTLGATLTGSGQGLYLRHAEVRDDFGTTGLAMIVGSGVLRRTSNAGETWEVVNDDAGETQLLASSPRSDSAARWFSNATLAGTTSFYESSDQGLTWQRGSVDIPCAGSGSAMAPSSNFDSDGIIWGSCTGDGSVYQSTDGTRTWVQHAILGSPVYSLASIRGGDTAIAGTANGLVSVNQLGQTGRLGFEGEQIHAIAASPEWDADPTILLITASGTWARTLDGGESWSVLTTAPSGYFLDLALSPDFVQDGIVVAAGYPGVFLSRDRGDTWSRLSRVGLYEEVSPHWSLSDGWRIEMSEHASGGGYQMAETGASMAINLRAVGFELIAPTGPGLGILEIQLDSQLYEVNLDAEVTTFGETVWSIDELSDGWHTLQIRVSEGPGAVDAIRSWSDALANWQFDTDDSLPEDTAVRDTASLETGDPNDFDTASPTAADSGTPLRTRCSCNQGNRFALLLIPLVLWGRRPRQRI